MNITRHQLGPTKMPFITITGDEPGETVFVVAGIHGDELVGSMVAWHLARCAQIARGALYIIPVVNTGGMALGMRGVPIDRGQQGFCEGHDLNRLFSASACAKPGTAFVIARQLYGIVRDTNPTIVVDLHNWIDPSGIFAIVDRPLSERARLAASQSEAFAQKFGVNVVRDLPPKQYVQEGHHRSLTGALVNHAHIPAFTVELGDVPRAKSMFVGIAGVLNVLKHCNMIEEGIWTPRVAEITNNDVMRLEEVRSSHTGVVRYDAKPGKLVFPGTRLARLTTENGEVIELKAKRVGIVLALGPARCKIKGEPLVTLAVSERRASWRPSELPGCQSASTNT